MPVLRERVAWSIPIPPTAAALTPSEQAGVRRALTALRLRYPSIRDLARAMKCSRATIANAAGRRAPTVALALLVARVAGTPISDVLTGQFPKPGTCLLCGQVTPTPNDAKVVHGP